MKKCNCGRMLDNKWFCDFCDAKKCDVCGIESKLVKAGRWIFYCPKHKQNDIDKTYENEIEPALNSEDGLNDCDGELSKIMESIF